MEKMRACGWSRVEEGDSSKMDESWIIVLSLLLLRRFMNEDNTNTSTQNTNPPFNSTNIRSSPFPELVILGSGGLTDYAGRSQAEVDSGYVEYRVYPFRSLPSGRVVRYDRGGWTGYAGLGMLLWLGYRLPWEKILQCWVQDGITVLRNVRLPDYHQST